MQKFVTIWGNDRLTEEGWGITHWIDAKVTGVKYLVMAQKSLELKIDFSI
jgi:hypothetical protein